MIISPIAAHLTVSSTLHAIKMYTCIIYHFYGTIYNVMLILHLELLILIEPFLANGPVHLMQTPHHLVDDVVH